MCYPAHPAWDRMGEIFRAAFSRNGGDPFIGPELDRTLRQHLDDPRTLSMHGLYFLAWGRKPIPEAEQGLLVASEYLSEDFGAASQRA